MRRILGFIAALAAFGDGAANAQENAAAVAVTVARVEARPVAEGISVIGRIEGSERVEIRARIVGFLEDVAFEEGGLVTEGDPLYRIDPAPFRAAVASAQGALDQARAEKTLADVQLTRAQELLDKNTGTVVARDQAQGEADRAAGKVVSAEAQLDAARIDLSYAEISAPISGRIGRTAYTRGALIGPESGVLATLVREDPMHVNFPISVRDFLEKGGAGSKDRVRVRLRLADGSIYPHEAKIDFGDVTVDRTSDTVAVRAIVVNPDRDLIDGQLVTVLIEEANPMVRPVIPQNALIADKDGLYVFVVEDGKAAARRVRPGPALGGDIAIEEGLAAGELVVVEGFARVRPGAAVSAQPLDAPKAN